MMMTPRELAIKALKQMKGDDLQRARNAFWRYLNSPAMDEQHGESGKTRAQILAEYEQQEAEIEAAIRWVQNVYDR
jgi:hypothetical protein